MSAEARFAELGFIGYPDTATALEAASLPRAQAPGVLAAHCYRTYLFGAALGTRDGLDWDAELLFVSAMLHDLGLTDFLGCEGPFEQRGATAAQEWLIDHGWAGDRASGVARAYPTSVTADLCRWGQITWRIEHSPYKE